MADGGTGAPLDLGAISDEETRRWHDDAERWGTDQYDERLWYWTVVEYVALAYIVIAGLAHVAARVWLALDALGLVD